MKKILIIIFFVIIFYFLFQFFSSRMSPLPYSAIFLAHGQVYFGHITSLTSDSIKLEDVYYLRTQTNLNTELSNEKEVPGVQLAIVKLGKEIHAPKNAMTINRPQVLFWEELRDDGEVVK